MFNTVVCAIGMGSRARVHHLIDTSRELLAPGGVLHFVHAVDRFPSLSEASPDAWATGVIAEAERKLCDFARALPVSPVIHVRVGRPDEVILAVASEVGADLILVAAHHEDILDGQDLRLDRRPRRPPCSLLGPYRQDWPAKEARNGQSRASLIVPTPGIWLQRAQLQQPVVVPLLWQLRRHDPKATFHEEPIYYLLERFRLESDQDPKIMPAKGAKSLSAGG